MEINHRQGVLQSDNHRLASQGDTVKVSVNREVMQNFEANANTSDNTATSTKSNSGEVGKSLPAEVVSRSGNNHQLKLADGQIVSAKIDPPVATGSKISLEVSNIASDSSKNPNPNINLKASVISSPAVQQGQNGQQLANAGQITSSSTTNGVESPQAKLVGQELILAEGKNLPVGKTLAEAISNGNNNLKALVTSDGANKAGSFQELKIIAQASSLDKLIDGKLITPENIKVQSKIPIAGGSKLVLSVAETGIGAVSNSNSNRAEKAVSQNLQNQQNSAGQNSVGRSPQKILVEQISIPIAKNNGINNLTNLQNLQGSKLTIIQNGISLNISSLNGMSSNVTNPNKASLNGTSPLGEAGKVVTLGAKNISALSAGQISELGVKFGGEAQGVINKAGQETLYKFQLDNKEIVVASKVPLEGVKSMTIRFSADGVAEVLHVLPGKKDVINPLANTADERGGGGENNGGKNQASSDAKNFPPLKAGSLHIGSITGQGEKGVHTLLMHDGRELQVQANRSLPVGAKLAISITKEGNAQILEMIIPEATTKVTTLTSMALKWEGLNNAFSGLTGKLDNQSENAFKNQVASLAGGFLPAMLNFSNAVANENAEKMFSEETVNILKAMGIDLSYDLHNLKQLTHKVDDNWRALLFPYREGEDDTPRQGGFYWRQHGGDDKDDKNSGVKSTRFVVNVALSALGTVQVDGLLTDRNMQIKLRLHKEISVEFKQGLENAVSDILSKLEMTGSISLEVKDFLDVDPLHELLMDKKQYNVKA